MIRLTWHNLLCFLIIILGTGCAVDDSLPPVDTCVLKTYPSGVYISNEGPFSDGSGTITYFDPSTKETQAGSFTFNNCDEILGSIVQSIYVHENKAYIIVNNSNKIIVADASTLEQLEVVEGFELPRFFLPVGDDKAFVSQWGADGVSGSVAVLDLNSLNILKTIPTGSGAENMIRVDGEVFVANAGGFSRDSTVSVINIGNEEVSATITVGDNPHSFAVDNIGQLWALAKGYSDFYDPTNNTPGKLAILENNQIAQSIDIANGSSWLAINNSGSDLYYLAPGGVFRQGVASATAEGSPVINGNFYSMAIDFNSDQIYAADAVDFGSDGVVYRYETDGAAIDSFVAGIIPGGFWFD